MKKILPFLTIILISISLQSCDRAKETNFIIHNTTSEDISVDVYRSSNYKINIPKGGAAKVYQKTKMGGVNFGVISIIDSLALSGPDFRKSWIRPSTGYINLEYGVGTERDPKDFYNEKNWERKFYRKRDDIIFTLTDADVESFK